MAALGASLSGWASNMENMAAQASMNMKECPECGEVVTAEHKFCPACGAALPEMTVGQAHTCPKCGKLNTPGTIYCAECGAVLPAGEEEAARQAAEREEEARLKAEEEAAAKAAAEREAARQAELAAKKNSGGGFGSILGGAGGKLGDIKDKLSEAADGFDAEEALGSAKNALKGLFGKK